MSGAETWGYTLQDSQVFRFQHVVLWLVVALAFSVIIRSLNELSDLERRRQEEDSHEKLPVIRDKEYFETKSRTEGLKMSENVVNQLFETPTGKIFVKHKLSGKESLWAIDVATGEDLEIPLGVIPTFKNITADEDTPDYPIIAGIGRCSPGDHMHPLYSTWVYMIHACYDEHSPYFKKKGEKGFTVCGRWKTFSNFAEDMSSTRDLLEKKGLPTKAFGIFWGHKEYNPKSVFFWDGDTKSARRNIVRNLRGRTEVCCGMDEAMGKFQTHFSKIQSSSEWFGGCIEGARFLSTRRKYSHLPPNQPFVKYNEYLGFFEMIGGDICDEEIISSGDVVYKGPKGNIVGYRIDIPDDLKFGSPQIVGRWRVSRYPRKFGGVVVVRRESYTGDYRPRMCFGGDLLHGFDDDGSDLVVGAMNHSPYVEARGDAE